MSEELARKLQAQFDDEVYSDVPTSCSKSEEMARKLQAQFDEEVDGDVAIKSRPLSIISEEWEIIDPTPQIHSLFLEFNQRFFWSSLLSCEVKWSAGMMTCAGVCSFSPYERYCSIALSVPLLKLRPRKDLVETLLHEMIHAYLFITNNNKDRDGHGPEFHKHMHRINKETGTNISVYHTFHDEVDLYKSHWWRCNGPCQNKPPFYGTVKRSMNMALGPNKRWLEEHRRSCGGTFTRIKKPNGFGKKGKKYINTKPVQRQRDSKEFINVTQKENITGSKVSGGNSSKVINSGNSYQGGSGGNSSIGVSAGLSDGNMIHGIKEPLGSNSTGVKSSSVGHSEGLGGQETNGKVGTQKAVDNPGGGTKEVDNSSGGEKAVDNSNGGEASGGLNLLSYKFNGVAGNKLGGSESGSSQTGLSVREMMRLKWGGGNGMEKCSSWDQKNSCGGHSDKVNSSGGHSDKVSEGNKLQPKKEETKSSNTRGANKVQINEQINVSLDGPKLVPGNKSSVFDDPFDDCEDDELLLVVAAQENSVNDDNDVPHVSINAKKRDRDTDSDDEPPLKRSNFLIDDLFDDDKVVEQSADDDLFNDDGSLA